MKPAAETRAPARLDEVGIACGLLALTCLLRAPFFGNVGEDEAFFAVVGRDWLGGALPYADRFDVKPPGLFLLYALAVQVAGASLATIKGLEILFVAASAYGLWRIGRDFFSAPVGAAAAALYPLYGLAMSGVNAPTSLFLSGFEIFAVLFALRAAGGDMRAAALSGLLFGCAFTVKQSAAVEAAAVFALLLIELPDSRVRVQCAWRFCLTGAIAPLAFVVYFLATGAFGAFWSGAVVAAGGRMGGDNVTFLQGLARLPGSLQPLLAPLVGAMLVLLRFGRTRAAPFARPLRIVLGWLGGALLAIVAMRAMYDHYFLPLAGPLLLLAGVAVFHLLDFGVWRRAILVLLVAGAVACPIWFSLEDWRAGAEDRPAVLAIARVARESGLMAGDSALVVNRGVMVYVETGARPASRVFHPQHLLCDFPTLPGDSMAAALAAQPRFVLKADAQFGMVCEKPERLALLQGVLDREYDRIAEAKGDWDRYVLYRRK